MPFRARLASKFAKNVLKFVQDSQLVSRKEEFSADFRAEIGKIMRKKVKDQFAH